MSAERPWGLLAEFEDIPSLLHASEAVRDAGYTQWDTHTPFPVHGLNDSMGLKPTRLPWFVFAAGLTGCTSFLALQWWTNAVDYAFNISGKPFFSLPANIPVTFEGTILLAALTAFFGMLVANKLPHWYHPVFKSARFARASNDRFFISIERADPSFDPVVTRSLLEAAGAVIVEELED